MSNYTVTISGPDSSGEYNISSQKDGEQPITGRSVDENARGYDTFHFVRSLQQPMSGSVLLAIPNGIFSVDGDIALSFDGESDYRTVNSLGWRGKIKSNRRGESDRHGMGDSKPGDITVQDG